VPGEAGGTDSLPIRPDRSTDEQAGLRGFSTVAATWRPSPPW